MDVRSDWFHLTVDTEKALRRDQEFFRLPTQETGAFYEDLKVKIAASVASWER